MQRFFVTESFAVTEEGEKLNCYGVRSTLGAEVRDLCFEEDKERLKDLVAEMNREDLDEQTAWYVIEDFCVDCVTARRRPKESDPR